jgi:SanA protein
MKILKRNKIKIKNLSLRTFYFSLKLVLILIIFFSALMILVPFVIKYSQRKDIFVYPYTRDIPETRVAIVFGAGAESDILRDRIKVAADLYKQGKIKKIIMSGDNRFLNYNEPQSMIRYAKNLGVPEDVMQPDYAGVRTYDTCYRAKNIFGINEAVLITQNFHLPRAIYLCSNLGIKSIGVTADLHRYKHQDILRIREFFALDLAVIDIYFRKPQVILGEKIEV